MLPPRSSVSNSSSRHVGVKKLDSGGDRNGAALPKELVSNLGLKKPRLATRFKIEALFYPMLNRKWR